jgi:Nucleotidyl transferase AbiEii toxin, Type IV TA system
VKSEPLTQHDYGEREVAAARRVLVDLGQVLGSYLTESVVIVGGWVPDLLIVGAGEPHIGSMDVDLALNAKKLLEGRYAEIVKAMLATGRYVTTGQPFKFQASVDLRDGGPTLLVDVDFLKPAGRLKKSGDTVILKGFRPLDAAGCAAVFRHPERVKVDGQMLSGVDNHVTVLVASIADFLVMKAYALAGREKPKDAYDISYCLDYVPGGVEAVARRWQEWRENKIILGALAHLREKFRSVKSYGPSQVAAFYDETSADDRQIRVRRAYELVNEFLKLVDS